MVKYEGGLIRKIPLISKFMTSRTGKQVITIHILLHISRSKGNQNMKFGQLAEHNMKNIFLQKTENEAGRLVPDRFLFLEKLYMW